MDTQATLEAILAILVLSLVGVGILVWRSFFSGYGRKKGENLATQEDIRAITHEVEGVKALYEQQLEWLRSKQQLRMAALEKRLAAHQEAYTRWRELMSKASSSDEKDVIIYCQQCEEWWKRNCLYLGREAREAFRQASFAAKDHPRLRAEGGGFTSAEVTENFDIIRKAGVEIVSGAELPSLGELEAEDVTDTGRAR